ncbi:MAG: NAD(P)/FAD-dependent oxidoreductase [Clostridia bacterium]|nr:NAD(P)/FAD-dependent oxidoreductase [Clostridia bacterium]
MKEKYDVIVVGAGNAGLSAAAAIAKNSRSVLVLERNSVPGGSATSFCRGRFEFEAALHELASVGTCDKQGSVYRLFEFLGIPMDWKYEKNAFRVIADGADGYDVTLPTGVESFADEMEKQCEGCRESVINAFKVAEKVNRGFEYLGKGKPDPKVLMTEHLDFMVAVSHSTDECLDALGMPKKAKDIMRSYWPYLGTPTSELDFAHYMVMVDSYVKYRPALPPLRSHQLSLAFEKVICESGGMIRYNCPVEKILVNESGVYGVIAGGREIYANYVVANCAPDVAYGKLIDSAYVPEKALKLQGARKISSLFFAVYLGLSRSCEEIGIKDYSVFLYNSPDANDQYNSGSSLDDCIIVGNCLNCAIPESSPEGTCTVFLTTMLSEDAWGDVAPEDYKKLKNKTADRMIALYEEKLGVSIRPYIEEIVIAAPPTFARYLGTPGGTPYGYEMRKWDGMLSRIMSYDKEQFISGLYFAGAHSERGDGYSSTYANGATVAKKILRKLSEGKTNG